MQAPWYTSIPTPYQFLISQQEDALQAIFNELSESSIANPGSISGASRLFDIGKDGSKFLGGRRVGVIFSMMIGIAMGIS